MEFVCVVGFGVVLLNSYCGYNHNNFNCYNSMERAENAWNCGAKV